MNFLNNGKAYILFERECCKTTYVDKSLLINAIYQYAQESNPYICITRPRRFGKSTAANMVAAFFDPCSAESSRKLFENLIIRQITSAPDSCWAYQGKLNVLRINMIDLITETTNCYKDFLSTFRRRIFEDIAEAYPEVLLSDDISISEALEKTDDTFVFVIDEWDAILEMPFMRADDRKRYIRFLKALLKDKLYVRFVYMTGVLPIACAVDRSSLNMFFESTAFSDNIFYPYFGLTNDEIQVLKQQKGYLEPSLENLSF